MPVEAKDLVLAVEGGGTSVRTGSDKKLEAVPQELPVLPSHITRAHTHSYPELGTDLGMPSTRNMLLRTGWLCGS